MPNYVDGYVLPVPRKSLAAYRRMAQVGAKIWKKHGALQYVEAFGDDLNVKCGLPFPRGIRSKPNETIVFAFIVFKSRAHRDRVNARVMKDPALMAGVPKTMPFDFKRMISGGFRVAVES